MNTLSNDATIRVLIADDDEIILACYREAFGESEATDYMKALDALDAELFDVENVTGDIQKFDIVACRQGQDAIDMAKEAANDGNPFDVVILDVRMPPGIDGVE
ncbi:MAG: GGDEF domain-containing response regulator, partial [Proteobacteria bacterium]|nr:GGDEF domain-containing response regulator [Pseudomonadota bacterium]